MGQDWGDEALQPLAVLVSRAARVHQNHLQQVLQEGAWQGGEGGREEGKRCIKHFRRKKTQMFHLFVNQ